MISTYIGLTVIGFTVAALLLLNLRAVPQENRAEEDAHLRRPPFRRLRWKRPV